MRALIVALVVALVALLAGCGSEWRESEARNAERRVTSSMREVTFVLDDGRVVTCIAWNQNGYVGGLSCDW